MKSSLVPGNFHELRFTVTSEMCPRTDAFPVHPVCATWTMVHYFELAGRMVLAPHLEPDEEGLGIHVSIDHRAPAPIGSTVTVRADAESVTHRRLVCTLRATGRAGLLAEGRFVQAILSKEKLARLFGDAGGGSVK